jgi:hypothetical protein
MAPANDAEPQRRAVCCASVHSAEMTPSQQADLESKYPLPIGVAPDAHSRWRLPIVMLVLDARRPSANWDTRRLTLDTVWSVNRLGPTDSGQPTPPLRLLVISHTALQRLAGLTIVGRLAVLASITLPSSPWPQLTPMPCYRLVVLVFRHLLCSHHPSTSSATHAESGLIPPVRPLNAV